MIITIKRPRYYLRAFGWWLVTFGLFHEHLELKTPRPDSPQGGSATAHPEWIGVREALADHGEVAAVLRALNTEPDPEHTPEHADVCHSDSFYAESGGPR
jgi:hypothetical protein